MSSYVQLLLDRYGPKGSLVDSNLMLLDLVGTIDISLVGAGTFNKLTKYTREDFELLTRLQSLFFRRVTTPHILTETSNLTGDLPASTRQRVFDGFSHVFQGVEELELPSFPLSERQEFRFLGLTDTGLVQLSEQFLVVSDDARMIAHLNRLGGEALNFNHLRAHLFR